MKEFIAFASCVSIESGGVRVAIASSRTIAPVVWQKEGIVRLSVR